MFCFILLAAIPFVSGSEAQSDLKIADPSILCHEERATPDAAKALKIFDSNEGLKADYVYTNILGQEKLIERMPCYKDTMTIKCNGQDHEIVIPNYSSTPYAYLSSIDEDGVISREKKRFHCKGVEVADL